MASRIEDYALIGDCRSAALVARDGSIDWLCWPRFDSAACFAALLGTDDHGHWRIAPDIAHDAPVHRYRGDTLIVETLFETATGRVTLIDFLAIDAPEPTLVRLVRGEAGEVAMRSDLTIRFDYGLTIPWVSRGPNDELVAVAGPSKLVLRTPVRLVGQDMATQATFTVPAGETVPFVLQHAESFVQHPAPCDAAAALARTRNVAVMAILHDLNMAVAYADDLIVMKDGRIVAQGHPHEILTAALVAEVFNVTMKRNEALPREVPVFLPQHHTSRNSN